MDKLQTDSLRIDLVDIHEQLGNFCSDDKFKTSHKEATKEIQKARAALLRAIVWLEGE